MARQPILENWNEFVHEPLPSRDSITLRKLLRRAFYSGVAISKLPEQEARAVINGLRDEAHRFLRELDAKHIL